MVLPDSSEGWRNGKTSRRSKSRVRPKVGPEIKDGKSRAKNGAPNRLGYRADEKEVSQTKVSTEKFFLGGGRQRKKRPKNNK